MLRTKKENPSHHLPKEGGLSEGQCRLHGVVECVSFCRVAFCIGVLFFSYYRSLFFLCRNSMTFYDKLCNPAKLYFLISMVAYVIILFQNVFTPNRLSLGPYSCAHNNCPLILILQLLYIAFWTWILNMICKINTSISWFILLLPFILYFIILLALIFDGVRAVST